MCCVNETENSNNELPYAETIRTLQEAHNMCMKTDACEKINHKDERGEWPFGKMRSCPLYDDDECTCRMVIAHKKFNPSVPVAIIDHYRNQHPEWFSDQCRKE